MRAGAVESWHLVQASTFEEVCFEHKVFEGSVVSRLLSWSTLWALAEEASLMEELRNLRVGGVLRILRDFQKLGLRPERGLRRVLRLRPLEVQVSDVEV